MQKANLCYSFLFIVSISFLDMGNYLDGYAKETCGHCGLNRTEQGHDGCIGTLKGVMNACCGHGQDSAAYVQFDHEYYKNESNKYLIKGDEAIAYIKKNSSVGK